MKKNVKQNNVIKITGLTITARKFKILDNVNINVPNNTLCAFIGSNGAGKTSTIKSLLGLRAYRHGTIKIKGVSAKDPKARCIVAYVPEKENFIGISARHFLLEQAEYYRVPVKKANDNIMYLCQAFDFDVNKLDISLKKLSSGLKKIIMIMNAFVADLPIIVMDEPTEYLDPGTRTLFYKLVEKKLKEGKTFLISTHNLDEIEHYATYVVLIDRGVIKHEGPWKRNGSGLRARYNAFKSTGETKSFHKE